MSAISTPLFLYRFYCNISLVLPQQEKTDSCEKFKTTSAMIWSNGTSKTQIMASHIAGDVCRRTQKTGNNEKEKGINYICNCLTECFRTMSQFIQLKKLSNQKQK